MSLGGWLGIRWAMNGALQAYAIVAIFSRV